MWIFVSFMVVYGLSAILFAFKEPPPFLESFYKVPAIFVFLPERWIVPAGRMFLGIGGLAVAVVVTVIVLRHS